MSGSRVQRALVLAFIILLSGHTALVAGVASERLVEGKTYYITLLKHPGCPNLVQHLGFNAKECASHNTVTLKPLSKATAAVWARWTLGVREERPDGSYVVQINNYWDPNTDSAGPRCLGKLNVVKPSLCNVGRDVSKVDLRVSSTQRWMLRPVGSKAYQIISLSRRSGCMRYLGGTGPCGALRPALFKRDSGSGLQRWSVKEVPSQLTVQPAGEPIVTSSVAAVAAWQVRWQDGTVGSPDQETYALKCTAADASTCFAPPLGPVADKIPRGAESGVLTGLPADTDLLCYVVALNSAGLVCSTPQVVHTLPVGPVTSPPGAPAIIASTVKTGAWSVTWQDGEAGRPQETLSAFCVDYGAGCGAVATGNSVYGIKRGVQTAEVTGIPVGKWSCYVQAQNVAGTACSAPAYIEVTLKAPPGTPTDLRGVVSGQSWTATWKDGDRGFPEETYIAYCGPRGGGCSVGKSLGTSETVGRGVQHATAKSLPPWTALDCWVVAVNTEGRACAGPLAVEVAQGPMDRAPGAPTQPQTVDITSDSWTVTWFDGIVGVPEETYGLSCVLPGQSCSAPALAASSGLPRGTQRATLRGLSLRTMYTCYVIARNSVAKACSTGLSVTTAGTGVYKPGKPTGVSTTVSGTTWVATWTDGYVGSPMETYTAKCVAQGAPCDSRFAQGATQSNMPRGTEIAYVPGLPTGMFSCFIVATNAAGTVCSDPAAIVVGNPTRPPGQPTGVSGTIQVTTWAARWTDGAVGNPQETYTVKCVAQGAGCAATAVGEAATGIARGTQAGSTGPLPAGASYSCYIIAVNSVQSVCSNPVTVTPGGLLVKPGQPTITGASRTANTVTLWWSVGSKGNPEEKYAVECHAWPSTCAAAAVGTPAVGIPRAAGTATTIGLPNILLACYVIAYNTNYVADDVCSLVYEVPVLP